MDLDLSRQLQPSDLACAPQHLQLQQAGSTYRGSHQTSPHAALPLLLAPAARRCSANPADLQQTSNGTAGNQRDSASRACLNSVLGPISHLSWNCRGSGGNLNSLTASHLAHLIASTKAQVIFVSETHSTRITKAHLNSRFPVIDSHVVPAVGKLGGLRLMWNDEVNLSIIHSCHHLILANDVLKPNNLSYNLVCIYGDPHHLQTTTIWQEVSHFVLAFPNTPTFCMGDLNNIVNANTKFGPNPVNTARIHNFCCLVKECGFFDLGYSGPAYTWTNKHFCANPTFQRLDRCLANVECCTVFPTTTVYHLPMFYNDHAPVLAVLQSKVNKTRKPFWFENWWLLEKDFQPTAIQSWNKTASKAFNACIHLAKDLKIWSRKKKPINEQLATLEDQLLTQQNLSPDQQNHSLQATLTQNHHDLLTKDAEYHRQRVKKLWATKGDRNTIFSSMQSSKELVTIKIAFLIDEHGNSVASPQEIANIFTAYFTHLFTTQLSDANNHYIHNHQVTITDEFTMSVSDEQELFDLLKQMKRDVSPGRDGLNVAFYRAACPYPQKQ
ncbi:hypothetical protein PR202_gb29523 [Eleusine coracana subsp. coracana]|uniref:Endonuclease/exonuclease/phosphatase domain-containing protein n=1 Tax=Eleusine coracana subsp. coracana TaxID=191504 RepID=A0AAV5G0I2_ELECO|nr:hypothetical protein PR202_gb29523 [Eleusine coracana subsp. coracana]